MYIRLSKRYRLNLKVFAGFMLNVLSIAAVSALIIGYVKWLVWYSAQIDAVLAAM